MTGGLSVLAVLAMTAGVIAAACGMYRLGLVAGDHPTDPTTSVNYHPRTNGSVLEVTVTNPAVVGDLVVGVTLRAPFPWPRFLLDHSGRSLLQGPLNRRPARTHERRRLDRGAHELLGVVPAGESQRWQLHADAEIGRVRVVLGRPGRLRVHDHILARTTQSESHCERAVRDTV